MSLISRTRLPPCQSECVSDVAREQLFPSWTEASQAVVSTSRDHDTHIYCIDRATSKKQHWTQSEKIALQCKQKHTRWTRLLADLGAYPHKPFPPSLRKIPKIHQSSTYILPGIRPWTPLRTCVHHTSSLGSLILGPSSAQLQYDNLLWGIRWTPRLHSRTPHCVVLHRRTKIPTKIKPKFVTEILQNITLLG